MPTSRIPPVDHRRLNGDVTVPNTHVPWQKCFTRNNENMILRLILLFTIVPFVELALLLQVHHMISSVWGNGIGLLVTLGSIIVTGVAGAALARQQGLSVIRQVQTQMGQGQVPGQALADGILVLIGAAFLLTPGFLTDIFGFSLLFPASRSLYRKRVLAWFQKNVRVHRAGGADVFVVDSMPVDSVPNDVIDIEEQ